MHMPVFSFEKISPAVASVSTTPAEKKQRGMIVQILDRLAEKRGKRSLNGDRTVDTAKPESKS
jgi:hypothetical protein